MLDIYVTFTISYKLISVSAVSKEIFRSVYFAVSVLDCGLVTKFPVQTS